MKGLFCNILFLFLLGNSGTKADLQRQAIAKSRHSFLKLLPHAGYHPVTYYVHPQLGNDANAGTSKGQAFETLAPIGQLALHPGDRVVLAAGETYAGSIQLINQEGSPEHPIIITSMDWDNGKQKKPGTIDFKGRANGILIQDCSYIRVSHLRFTGNGYADDPDTATMRCGVLVKNQNRQLMTGIQLDHLFIQDVYYENPGFVRSASEVKSANGTQRYGWGIRVISTTAGQLVEHLTIADCDITDVSHTGIKLTGSDKNISNVNLLRNQVTYTGGPGIQMSEVKNVYVAHNVVDHSGSANDSRKWGRGSGLWTWGSSNVLIEKNRFSYANGPGDSDGAHIDFNCSNIIIQYNLSCYNAGGFCEILGNTYHCIYRYNISVNDGYRIKGKDGAFQEGKTLWLSGYQGTHQPRKGPVNTYIYNNTIYADATLQPKIAFDNTSEDVMIANNIFYVVNPFQLVLGDQYKPDENNNRRIKNMQLKNNLFLQANSWPSGMGTILPENFTGDPQFQHPGGVQPGDYTPIHLDKIKSKGVKLSGLPVRWADFPHALVPEKDILGKQLPAQPGIGAIEP
jgi:hypothetical protein